MKTVRLLKAKSRLSSLLEQVKRGEEVTITRHGKAVCPPGAGRCGQPRPAGEHGRAAEGVPAWIPAERSVDQGP